MVPVDIIDLQIASIRSSPLAAVVTDPFQADNPIVAANSAFERLTGYGEAELLGRNCRILAGPKTDWASAAKLREAVEKGCSAVVELVNYRKDGSSFQNVVMIAPVLGEDGKPCCFVGTQMEVKGEASGERERAVRLVAQLTARQREVLRLMSLGLRNRDIGRELGLTEKTVKMHRGALVRRLGLVSSIEAVRLAMIAEL